MFSFAKLSLAAICTASLQFAAPAVFATEPSASSQIQISNARVREPIPGRMMSAAFLTLKNTAKHTRKLVSVSAEWAGLIEIHTHLHEDGVMKMRQINSLEIPGGESVVLEPGGLHLMLFKLQLPLEDTLPMELCFSNGECIETTATLFSPM
jgi:copper(I)-binding protein